VPSSKSDLRPLRPVRLARAQRAFTLTELMVATAISAVLFVLAVPYYQGVQQQLKVTTATVDLGSINTRIQRYITLNGVPPADLSAVGEAQTLDPWANPYVYLSFTGLNGKGQMRKDKNLVPINTQYDLYSMGADGQSKPPLTAKESQDDVIVANDGNYIGLASNY
jgi:general secretion pathway protein G